ncbi:hypothetical protein GRX03_12035 [Halovenus sp. WSH3]|uniref:Uncharacterized protein n=1 Tax=Halovenus carboxidivorans TaxID=2692199 RepID=A0A6B0TGM0_9EURY|nr:hypothetical protein [Halovenus carboxidivorans]MXR52329.1 hypothetical protein [Halovenus carboxidivorans]
MDDESSDTEAPESEILSSATDEGRVTLDHQIATIRNTSDFAFRMLRLNLVLIGALLSSVPVAAQFAIPIGVFINEFTVPGVGFLFGSILTAAAAHTLTTASAGIGPGGLMTVTSDEPSGREFHERLSESYAEWIAENHRTLMRQNGVFILSMLLFINSAIFLGAGFVAGIYDPGFGSRPLYLLLTAAITLATDLVLLRTNGYEPVAAALDVFRD